jgi:hypothetical protein
MAGFSLILEAQLGPRLSRSIFSADFRGSVSFLVSHFRLYSVQSIKTTARRTFFSMINEWHSSWPAQFSEKERSGAHVEQE